MVKQIAVKYLNVKEDKKWAFKKEDLDSEMQGTEGTIITNKFR